MARALREKLSDMREQLADAVVGEVRSSVALRPADDATIGNLHLGAQVAVASFLARIESGAGDANADDRFSDRELFVAHGRAQQHAGRTLPELLAFYRLGGLAIWRVLCELSEVQRLDGRELATLTAEMLAFIDELSIAATEGFEDERARRRRADAERRRRLHELLLAREPASIETLRAAADDAGWSLPARIRAAIAQPPRHPPANALASIPSRVVAGTIEGGRRSLVVADAPDAEDWLLRAARRLELVAPLAVGPAVDVRAGATSARLADRLLDHVAPRAPAGELLRCDDHMVELLLTADTALAGSIALRELDALDALTGAQHERARETLVAWLEHPGQTLQIARKLGIHPQTVRYRLRQLRDLFGPALDDPDARFSLAIALRARGLLEVVD